MLLQEKNHLQSGGPATSRRVGLFSYKSTTSSVLLLVHHSNFPTITIFYLYIFIYMYGCRTTVKHVSSCSHVCYSSYEVVSSPDTHQTIFLEVNELKNAACYLTEKPRSINSSVLKTLGNVKSYSFTPFISIADNIGTVYFHPVSCTACVL